MHYSLIWCVACFAQFARAGGPQGLFMLQRMLAVCWNPAVHCLCHSLNFFWCDNVFHIGFAGIIDMCCIEYIECMQCISAFGESSGLWMCTYMSQACICCCSSSHNRNHPSGFKGTSTRMADMSSTANRLTLAKFRLQRKPLILQATKSPAE